MTTLRALPALFLLAMLALSLTSPLVATQADERAQLEILEGALRNLQRALERSRAPEAQRVRTAVENALKAIAEIRARGGSFEEALRETIAEMSRVRLELRALEEQENRTAVPPGLIVAIEVRLRMIEDLRKVVSYLEEHGVEVDPKVASLLDEAESRALSLKERLEAGNVTVEQAAKEIGEISRLIAEARVQLAKSKGEWAKLQFMNAVARSVARAAATFRERLLTLEELSEEEIRKGLADLEKTIVYRHALEKRFKVESEYCDIEALLKELGVEPTPGFFGRAVAKLAREDPESLRRTLIKIKRCLIEILASTNVENVPGVNETDVAAVKSLVSSVRKEIGEQFANLVRETARKLGAPPWGPAKASVDLEMNLSLAHGKKWVSLEPANPNIKLSLEGSSGLTTVKNVAKLKIQRATMIQVIVSASSASGADVNVSLKLILSRTGGEEPIEIPIPCAASSMDCYRIQSIIVGHDVPVLVPPGEYVIDLEIAWATSGESQVRVNLTIR